MSEEYDWCISVDRVRNEVVRVRTGVRRELATRVDTNVLRWFSHLERME